jgi:hypothetical protein
MAARQKATRHELADGFVAAWDSSEVDEDLRRKLIELAERPLGEIVVGMGAEAPVQAEVEAPPVPASRRKPRSRRRPRTAAA